MKDLIARLFRANAFPLLLTGAMVAAHYEGYIITEHVIAAGLFVMLVVMMGLKLISLYGMALFKSEFLVKEQRIDLLSEPAFRGAIAGHEVLISLLEKDHLEYKPLHRSVDVLLFDLAFCVGFYLSESFWILGTYGLWMIIQGLVGNEKYIKQRLAEVIVVASDKHAQTIRLNGERKAILDSLAARAKHELLRVVDGGATA